MIFTERQITVHKGKSTINEPVILYRGDYEVSIKFTIMESKFRFKSGVNLVDSEKASHGQLAILAPYGGNVFSEIVKCEDGTVTFTLTKEMIDQLEEVGLYSFQIRLFDYYRESRVSIPPVEFGIEVREPVASEDHDNSVNNAIVGYSIAKVVDPSKEDVGDTFDDKGNYNKTDWETGDRITEGKLNKIEDALDKMNQNEKNDVAALDKRIASNYNVLDSTKADKNEIFSMANMGQDVKEAMTGGSVAVVGRDGVLNENIVDSQISVEKTNFIVYEGQTQLYDGTYETNKYLTLKNDNWLYPVTGDNEYFYCEIPIKENSTIRIKARNINRCRVGIAYDSDINANGTILRASKVLINDDSLTSCDYEFTTISGKFLVMYLGSNLEEIPTVEVLQRDTDARINFANNLNLSETDLNFLKHNPIEHISNKFVISKYNNGLGLYRKDNLTEEELLTTKYVTLFLNIEKHKSVNMKFKGNRGSFVVSKKIEASDYYSGDYFYNNSVVVTDGSRVISYNSDRVTIINEDNILSEYEYDYICEEGDKTLILYISTGTDDYSINIEGFKEEVNAISGNGVKITADYISENVIINGKNILDNSIDKKALSFNINDVVSTNNAVNIPFWEVPTQPNTWATTSSGKDLNINSEEFMDLFFNSYIDKEYDDGYKVTKTLLGKDQSDTYNIYEYVFEPKNYTRTIIITSGNHPYELPAHFGFGRFMYYIMNEPDIHEGIRYIRDNVRIVTIPVINPWGFSQSPKIYGNCNLVNINRNFDSNGRWANFPTGEGNEWNYKGTAPFSERETQILRDFYIKYKDEAEWAIDCHCGNNTDLCDAWIVGLSGENVLLPKIYKAINMFDERCRKVLGREPINKIQLDMDSSIRCWYSLEQLGLPNISTEYRPQRYGGNMNGSIDLTYYLMYLSNYVFQALSFTNDELRHNQILLNRKLDLILNRITY